MLTPLELDIMKVVWQRPGITVRDVQDSIRPSRPLAYTTVMTVMDRLYHKGFLTRILQARTHYYEPAVDYTKVRDEAVESLIKSFFGSKEKLQQFLEGDEGEGPGAQPKVQIEPVSPRALDEALL